MLGKPLIAHSILQAKASGLFEYVAVSSDSVDILNVAKEWGADYCIKRADDLASDHAAKHPAIQHCFKEVERLTALTFDMSAAGAATFNNLVDATNYKVAGAQGSDGQVLTSTGSGVAWEDAAEGGISMGKAIAAAIVFG